MKYRIIYILFILSFVIFFFSCKKEITNILNRDYPEIKSSGIINIVTEYNSENYYIFGDTIKGNQYDLIKYIEKQSGLKVNINLENNLERSIQKLNSNEYDIIACNIPITEELGRELSFTIPIAKDKHVLVQRKKEESNCFISTQLDLANKKIYVPKNSPAIFRILNLSEEIAEPIFINEDHQYTAEQLLYMVAFNEIDYTIVNQKIALNNQKIFPNIDINMDIGFNQFQAWGIRKDCQELRDSLNNWIKKRDL